MCSYPQVHFELNNKLSSHGNPLVAIVSPAVLEHPFQLNEVARGSKRMAYDIPACVQDVTRKFIMVGFQDDPFRERIKILPVFLYYCLVHEYDMLVYWEKSEYCDANYSDVLCTTGVSQNAYKVKKGLAPLSTITVHVWEQPKWDGWNDRKHQSNCAGSFLADGLTDHPEDFNIESLSSILFHMSDEVTRKMKEWQDSFGFQFSIDVLTAHFALRDNYELLAKTWLAAQQPSKDTGKPNKPTIGLLIDFPAYAFKQLRMIAEVTGNKIPVPKWMVWKEGAVHVKQHALQKYGENNFILVVLTDHPDVFDAVRNQFGNTVCYGPVHDAGFHARGMATYLEAPSKDTATNLATALACDDLAGWSGSPLFEYAQCLGEFGNVLTIPMSCELVFQPDPHAVLSSSPISFLDLRCEKGMWGARSSTYRQVFNRNSVDIGGSLVAYSGIPKHLVPVMKEINTEPIMSMFHSLVQNLARDTDDKAVTLTKLGQVISSQPMYSVLVKNKNEYNKDPSLDTVGTPKWMRAVFEGPYKHYRRSVLDLPPYYHYGEGEYKLLINERPQTGTESILGLSAVPKAASSGP